MSAFSENITKNTYQKSYEIHFHRNERIKIESDQ